ncbi:MAG: hypothetical protein U0I94_05605, partial [Collinsella sp.]|nr:hypothetical protein [Collinsella sp.]
RRFDRHATGQDALGLDEVRARAFRREPGARGLYPKSKPPFLRVVLILPGVNDSFTPDDLIVFGIELLFKENKSNNKGNCYDRNDQKQDCQSMLLASFTCRNED